MLPGVPVGEVLLLAAAILVGGILTGLIAGLLGIGGAAVTVPVLYELFRFLGVPDEVRMQLCVGTSLAVIVPLSLRSYFAHRAKAAVLDHVLRLWTVPVMLGATGGALLAFVAPGALFKLVFVVFGAALGLKLLLAKESWRIADSLPGKPVTIVLGYFIGLVSALMGVAGGTFSTVYLTLFGQPIHVAIATSSGLGIMISLPGAVGYMIAGWPQMELLPPFSLGYVSLIGLLLFAPASVLAAPVGARLTHRLPRRKLEVAFALFLLAVSVRFLVSLL